MKVKKGGKKNGCIKRVVLYWSVGIVKFGVVKDDDWIWKRCVFGYGSCWWIDVCIFSVLW